MKTLKEKLIGAGISPVDAIDGIGFTLPALTEEQSRLYDVISSWHFGDLKLRTQLLWRHINNLVVSAKIAAGLDENAHGKISMWTLLKQLPPEKLTELGIDDPMPEWRLLRLAEIDKWSDKAWKELYYPLKARVEAGEDVELPESIPPCPVTFGQLLLGE